MPLTHKRVLAGLYLVLLGAAAGNAYLGWGYFGSGRAALAVVTFVGTVVVARYGSGLVAELKAHRSAQSSGTGKGDGA